MEPLRFYKFICIGKVDILCQLKIQLTDSYAKIEIVIAHQYTVAVN